MPKTIVMDLTAAVAAGPTVKASSTMAVDAYDKVSVLVPAGATIGRPQEQRRAPSRCARRAGDGAVSASLIRWRIDSCTIVYLTLRPSS